MPVPMGGVASERLLRRTTCLVHASALQHQDPRCWGGVPNIRAAFDALRIDTERPLRCPVTVIQGDARCGAACSRATRRDSRRRTRTRASCDTTAAGITAHRALKYEARFREDLGAVPRGEHPVGLAAALLGARSRTGAIGTAPPRTHRCRPLNLPGPSFRDDRLTRRTASSGSRSIPTFPCLPTPLPPWLNWSIPFDVPPPTKQILDLKTRHRRPSGQ